MAETTDALAAGGSRAGEPAGDLAEVWELLDALPAARGRVDLAATTVDLVAARVAEDAARPERQARGPAAWGIRGVIVGLALVAGLAAGRSLAPDPDRRVLEQLPLIEHLGLLREAGSVDFLEAVADRMAGRQGPPRWMRLARDPEELRADAREFDDAIAHFEREPLGRDADQDVIQQRRQRVESLAAGERAELERAAEIFENLASIDRRELMAVAQALRDPGGHRLRDAARTWHTLLAWMNPVFRRTLVDMPVSERLEFMDQRPDRFEPRPSGRPRDEPRERRPPEGRRPDSGDQFDGPGPRPSRVNANGLPRADGFPGRFNGPPFRPSGPPPAGGPQGFPPETPAPPR